MSRFGLESGSRALAILLIFGLILAPNPALIALAEEGGDAGNSAPEAAPPPPEPDPTPPPADPPAAEPSEPSPEPAPESSETSPPTDGELSGAGSSGASEPGDEGEASLTTEPNDAGTASPPSGDSTTTTGDAIAEIDVTNQVNTNETSATIMPTSDGDTELATSTEQGQPAGELEAEAQSSDGGITATTTVSAENDAQMANDLTGLAITGANAASTTIGDASINTGNATATANVINISNTNAVGGGLTIVLVNAASSTAAIDLRPELATSTGPFAEDYGFPENATTTLIVTTDNRATTTNTITLVSETGGNDAASVCGDATITTGNAAVAANVVNIMNTNFIGSELIIVTVNQLGDWRDDLVLPGKAFFERFFAGPASSHGEPVYLPSQLDMTTTNRATVANDVSVRALSGGNDAASAGGETAITTGRAMASANIQNHVNQNYLGTAPTFSLLVNVAGRWTGSIFSSPPGSTWAYADGRLEVTNRGNGIELGGAVTDSNPGAAENSLPYPDRLSASSTNDALLANTIEVVASSGGNAAAAGCGGHAEISTGSAVAAANVLNLVNSNVIGTNWFLALVNVAGNWDGDVAFGRPNLWLGETATLSQPEPIRSGATITYNLTVLNHGDTDATGVRLTDRFAHQYLGVTDTGSGATSGPGEISWDLGTIPVGGMRSRSYTLSLDGGLPSGVTYLTNSSLVTSYEDDDDPSDNADSLSILAEFLPFGSPPVLGAWPPALEVTKTNETTGPISASSTVNYTITVKNVGSGPAYNAKVVDALKSPKGKVLKTFTWQLGEIYPQQKVIIDYTVAFASSAPPGIYVNSAHVEGRGGVQWGYFARSNTATSAIEIAGSGETATSTGNGEPDTPDLTATATTTLVVAAPPPPPRPRQALAPFILTAQAAPTPPPLSSSEPHQGLLAALLDAGLNPLGLGLILAALLGWLILRAYEDRRRRARPRLRP